MNHDFSLATGELTPTLKLKRGYICSRYKEEIEKMYSWGVCWIRVVRSELMESELNPKRLANSAMDKWSV